MRQEEHEFIKYVCGMFDELKQQFIDKQNQYATGDPLANFRKGALVRHGSASYSDMYNIALDYETKHIAHVLNHDIHGNKIDESLRDIVIYSIIELYFISKKNEKS